MRIRFSCAVLFKLMGARKQLLFILLVPGWVRALVALVGVGAWVGGRWLGMDSFFAWCWWPAVGRGVFWARSGFRVGWRAAGWVWLMLCGGLLLLLAGFWLLLGGWALDHHLMGFRHFPNIS